MPTKPSTKTAAAQPDPKFFKPIHKMASELMDELWEAYREQNYLKLNREDAYNCLARRVNVELLKLLPQRTRDGVLLDDEGNPIAETDIEVYYNDLDGDPAGFKRRGGTNLTIEGALTFTSIRYVLKGTTEVKIPMLIAFLQVIGITLEEFSEKLYDKLKIRPQQSTLRSLLKDTRAYVKGPLVLPRDEGGEERLTLSFIYLPVSDAPEKELAGGTLEFRHLREDGMLHVSGKDGEDLSLEGAAVITAQSMCWCFLRRGEPGDRDVIWTLCFKVHRAEDGKISFGLPCAASSMTLAGAGLSPASFRVLLYDASAPACVVKPGGLKFFLGHIRQNNKKMIIKESDWQVTEKYFKLVKEQADTAGQEALKDIAEFFAPFDVNDMRGVAEAFGYLVPSPGASFIVIDPETTSGLRVLGNRYYSNGEVLQEMPQLKSWLRYIEDCGNNDMTGEELDADIKKLHEKMLTLG